MEYTITEQLKWLERHQDPIFEAIKGSLHELLVIRTSDNNLRWRPAIPVDLILGMVCREFDVTIDQLKAKHRKDPDGLVMARQTAIFLLQRHTYLAQWEIGEMFNRDRTTVPYAKRKIQGYMDVYPDVKKQIYRITSELFIAFDQMRNGKETISELVAV